MKQIIPVGGPKPAADPAGAPLREALQYAHETATVAKDACDEALREALKQALESGRFTCANCGRRFDKPDQFRYNVRHDPICREPCREAK